ncbi:phosphotransferase enzyme family protein [Vibrio parahaemolyticus]|uniref:phosphotransferase enzyme family protein n=1 Tax=Vibrio parahaemolyticus TaxID=670 RepID=UPI00356939C1
MRRLCVDLARLHLVGSKFGFEYPLEVQDDLIKHLPKLEEILKDRKDLHQSTVRRIKELHVTVSRIGKGLVFGPCHGDIHSGNVLQSANGKISILDFKSCGNWSQSFDVASYICSASLFGWAKKYADSFFQGYESIRVLNAREKNTLSLFASVRDAWHLVTWARKADVLGCEWFHDYRIDSRMKLFYRLAESALK